MAKMMEEAGKAAGPVAGTKDAMVNLKDTVDHSKATCLNQEAKGNLKGVLKSEQGATVASDQDVDAQLLLFIPFMEAVKIHGFSFTTLATSLDAKTSGPKTVKIFVDQPNLDFDGAAAAVATQTLVLTAAQLDGRQLLSTFVKFQKVHSLTIFIVDNQKNSAGTVLNRLSFVGTPLAGMNVSAIKKVGEDS